jgi:hypothetical protein
VWGALTRFRLWSLRGGRRVVDRRVEAWRVSARVVVDLEPDVPSE